MNSTSDDQLQDYAACFSAEDDLTYLEIWNFQDSQKDIWTQGPVAINELGFVKLVCAIYPALNLIKTQMSQRHNLEDAIEGFIIM